VGLAQYAKKTGPHRTEKGAYSDTCYCDAPGFPADIAGRVARGIMSCQVILLVEDEVLIRMLLAEVLRDKGYQVIEAASGDEGLAILLSGQHVTMIITDVRMPGQIDGMALATRAKQAWPQRPVVVMSSHLPAADAAIADKFIAKPFVPAMLMKTIENLIGPPCQTPPPHNQTAS